MPGYDFDMALRSCRRSKALTALVVLLMGCGVACCMVTYAVFRATSADPIPWKSGQLFVPQIDNFGPANNNRGEPSNLLDYTDAMALLQARQARRQTLIYALKWAVVPADGQLPPFTRSGDAVTSDFFAMFDTPFRYGGSWSMADDDHRAAVAVINRALNRKLFGGADSVGRLLRLNQHDYRIVGVLDDWHPQPRVYDHASAWEAYGEPAQIFIPFARAVDLHQAPGRNVICGMAKDDPVTPDWDSFLHSECTWIAAWVELRARADAVRYRRYLDQYAEGQQAAGRFDWPPNVRLSNLRRWMVLDRIVPRASELSLLVSVSFLLICLVNVVGLMLARFMRRAGEIGVRRALGASRGAIHRQFLVEAGVIGLAGGLLGLLLTIAGMAGIGQVFEPGIARLVHVDMTLVLLTVLVAITTTLGAAIYPAWCAAQVPPAWQLKVNG